MRIFITGGSGFIGTNLIDFYSKMDVSILNYDWNPPLNPEHLKYWLEGDIMDYPSLHQAIQDFAPNAVVHFAARTDSDIHDLDGDINEYIQNTLGTKHVLNAINFLESVERAVITSTQFVCEAGYLPQNDLDYKPYTLYGKSKLLTEQYTRKANLNCIWTIIRPSTIWGPWALRYRDNMFKVMKKGWYFHPSKKNVKRSYGYVKNVIYQIDQILHSDSSKVNRQVFYVGDEPIDLSEWVKTISYHLLNGKPVTVVPTFFVKGLALTGDVLKLIGISFPITSVRFNSMTRDYITPIHKTIEAFGIPPYDMNKGAKEMVDWYNDISHTVKLPKKKYVASDSIKSSEKIIV